MSLLACGCSYDDARRALVAQVAVLSRRLADSMQREEDTRRRAAESVEAYEGRLVVLQAQVDDLLAESVQIRADSELLVSVSTSSWLASRGRCPRVTASCAMLQAQVAAQQTVARERLLMADHVASATAASREQVASEVAQMRQELEAAQQQVAKRNAALAAARRNYRSKEAVLVADAKKLSTVRGGVGACVRCASLTPQPRPQCWLHGCATATATSYEPVGCSAEGACQEQATGGRGCAPGCTGTWLRAAASTVVVTQQWPHPIKWRSRCGQVTDLEGRLRDTRNRAEKYKRTTLQAHARIAELERAVALSMQPPPAAPGEAVSPVGTADAFGALEGFLPHTNRPPLPVSDELANLRDVQATLTANRSCVAARLRRPSRALTWARGIFQV